LIKPEVARPAFDRNDREVCFKAAFAIEHSREFADGHASPQGHGVKGGEAAFAAIDRAFHACAVDGIYAVEHEEFQVCLSRGLQTIAHRGDISIKAATNVLNIEHERVEVLQLFQLRRAARAVKTVNWQAGLFVHAVADVLVE